MSSPIPNDIFQTALAELGILPQDIAVVRSVPFPQAQVHLQGLKVKAKKAYKMLALDLHPDRTGGDPVKAEKFQLLTEVLDTFERFKIEPPAPIVARVFFPPIKFYPVPVPRSSETMRSQNVASYIANMLPRGV